MMVPPGSLVPVRRIQTRKGRNEVDPTVVLDIGRELFDFAARADHSQVVAQPLHQRACYRD